MSLREIGRVVRGVCERCSCFRLCREDMESGRVVSGLCPRYKTFKELKRVMVDGRVLSLLACMERVSRGHSKSSQGKTLKLLLSRLRWLSDGTLWANSYSWLFFRFNCCSEESPLNCTGVFKKRFFLRLRLLRVSRASKELGRLLR